MATGEGRPGKTRDYNVKRDCDQVAGPGGRNIGRSRLSVRKAREDEYAPIGLKPASVRYSKRFVEYLKQSIEEVTKGCFKAAIFY